MKILYQLIIFFFFCFATLLNAEQTKFIIGVENYEYLPYYSPSKKQGYSGVGFDILNAFGKDLEYSFTFKEMSIPELCVALETGVIDFKFPYDVAWNCKGLNKKDVITSKGFVDYTDGILNLPENAKKGLSSIKSIGTIVGFTTIGFEPMLEANKLHLVEFKTSEELVKAVLDEDVNIAYMNIKVGLFTLRKMGKKTTDLEFNKNYPSFSNHYRIATKKYPEIIKEFNYWIEKNHKRADYFLKKYGLE